MASRGSGSGSVPLFDGGSNSFQRSLVRAKHFVDSIPPLQLFMVALLLLFLCIGLITSLGSANGEIMELQTALETMHTALAEDGGQAGGDTGTAASVHEQLQSKLQQNVALREQNANLTSKLAELKGRLDELEGEETNCDEEVNELLVKIKRGMEDRLKADITIIRDFIDEEQDKLVASLQTKREGVASNATNTTGRNGGQHRR
eukprot:CAMPEP_0117648140 /NCGR_PEP_ID=MMETSP0804-20121206/231_1 /TAXON_ID=1074897 /ORGANISM="Tetraselmis astigmatica, Strain CCMP880" /LENGTH=203 /DNA_ID=CAMNT_0005453693 /DNA_START=54 /DNA_END=665 /DNA_ORIENTATION=+